MSEQDDSPRFERPEDPLWAGRPRPDDERGEPERRFSAPEPEAIRGELVAPADPAGTAPKVDASSLVPEQRGAGGPPAIEPPAGAMARAGDGEGGGAVALRDVEAPQAARFQFLLGALLALGVLAIGLLAYGLTTTSSDDGSGSWSPWRPTSTGISGAQEIAEHVAPQYRLPTGEQLVFLAGGKLEVADLPTTIVMRDAQGSASLVEGSGVLYKMCGLGPKCSIDKGTPSQARHLLLRREALELALYTFRYLKGIDQVVVMLPPPTVKDKTGKRVALDPSQALFFRRGDVTPELRTSLRATLPAPPPTVSDVRTSKDIGLVDRITSRGLFSFRFAQAQDQAVYLVLEPLATATASAAATTAPGASSGPSPASGSASAGGGTAKKAGRKTAAKGKPGGK